MLPLVSVIVPVYNTVPYLDKCIHSILNQSYENLEIILVNDGSTDGSANKCDEFSRMDKRIHVIHKENGGPSSARNAGLDICNGQYVSFIDSDDWIESDMYSVLVEQLEKYDVDLVISGRYDAYEGAQEKHIGKSLNKNGLFDVYDILPLMILGQLSDFSACDKLYRKCLWENIRFPEGVIYEDFAVMYRVVISAKSVVLCDRPFYVYNHHSGSIVTSGFREALTDYPKHTKEFVSYINSLYPEFADYAVWTHIIAILLVLTKLLKCDKSTYVTYHYLYVEYFEEIKKYKSVWHNSPVFTWNIRMMCSIMLHKRLARFLFRMKSMLDVVI